MSLRFANALSCLGAAWCISACVPTTTTESRPARAGSPAGIAGTVGDQVKVALRVEPPGETQTDPELKLDIPLTLRSVFDVDFEHGCSESFESLGTSGEMNLKVLENGEAVLTLEYRESEIFGPSRGRFEQGQDQFSYTGSKHRSTLRGVGRVEAGRLLVKFETAENAFVVLPRYGDSDYPPPVKSVSGLVMTCEGSRVPVLSASLEKVSTEEEEPVSEIAVVCDPGGELFNLSEHVLVNGGYVFGAGEGLIVRSHTMFGNTSLAIHRAPPAAK